MSACGPWEAGRTMADAEQPRGGAGRVTAIDSQARQARVLGNQPISSLGSKAPRGASRFLWAIALPK